MSALKVGLLLGGDPHSGGLFQYTLALLDAVSSFPRDRFDVLTAHLHAGWREDTTARGLRSVSVRRPLALRLADAAIRRAGMTAPASFGGEAHTLRVLARQRRDVWLVPNADLLTFNPALAGYAHLPIAATVHDLMHRYERRFPEVGGEHDRRERVFAGMCRFARAILVDSELGRWHVHESFGFPLERTYVLPFVPPGYVLAPPSAAPHPSLRTLPEKYIFYPAQFWEHKNHPRLIRAVASAIRQAPDMALVLVGSARHNGYAATAALVDELGLRDRVRFLGYVPNEAMGQLYRRARAMVFPTFFGPTNIPPLEAFATGCPSAVSNIYAMPEQVGDAALLFDPNSIDEIANVLVRLWTDDALCAELARRGRARSEAWTPAHFNARVREIVSAVVGGGVSH